MMECTWNGPNQPCMIPPSHSQKMNFLDFSFKNASSLNSNVWVCLHVINLLDAFYDSNTDSYYESNLGFKSFK